MCKLNSNNAPTLKYNNGYWQQSGYAAIDVVQ